MSSHLLAFCFCLLSVSYGAPAKRTAKGQEDAEEADLYKLKPMVGQFLERPLDLENYQNEASVEKAILNSKNRDEEDLKDEEEDGVNSLLKTVLITLRDRPDIIMAILQDEERKNMEYRRPPEQLELKEPKRVVKKGCDTHHVLRHSSEASDSSEESQENSESRDGEYYKNKYDKSSESSEGSDELDLAQYYKQKYGKAKDDYKSESTSPEEDEDKRLSTVSLDKRVPEQPEETIDITSLPDENDVDLTNIISEGGLEDLPEYRELKENSPKSSKGSLNLGHDASGVIHTSSRLDGKNAQQKHSALKPVVTEAEMSQNSKEDSRDSLEETKEAENTKNEGVAGNMKIPDNNSKEN